MRTEVRLGAVHAYRYPSGAEPSRYDLLIVHGIGGHGGTYNVFCEPLAARGVTIHSLDLPGHGQARNPSGVFRFIEWLEDIDEAARRIKKESDRPLFILGSSQGSAAAFHSLAFSAAVDGAVTMGIVLNTVAMDDESAAQRMADRMRGPDADAIAEREGDQRRIDLRTAINWDREYAREDTNVLEKKLADPLRTWSYGYASMHSYWNYVPPVPPSENRKPVLVTAGGDDPLMPGSYVRACFDAIGGPKELYVMPGAGHQLMLYYTDAYVDVIDGWLTRQAELLSSGTGKAAR